MSGTSSPALPASPPASSASEPVFLDKSHPSVWKALNGVALAVRQAVEAAGISRETLEVMYVRISQLNGCSYCLDLHTTRALEAGASLRRIAQLAAWEESQVFSPEERAALTVAEVATILPAPTERRTALADARATVGDEAFAALEWAAVSMNAYNRVSILSEHPVVDDRPTPTSSATHSAPHGTSPATPPATPPDTPADALASAPAASDAPKPHPHHQEDEMSEEISVRDAADRQRFEISVGDELAGFSGYRDTDVTGAAQRILHHTEIEKQHGGKGLAATLTREAIAASVAASKRIVPVCPYVKRWVEKNTEFAAHIDPVRPEHLQLIG